MKIECGKLMTYLEKQVERKKENLVKYHKSKPELSYRKLALIFHMDLAKVYKVLKKAKENKKPPKSRRFLLSKGRYKLKA